MYGYDELDAGQVMPHAQALENWFGKDETSNIPQLDENSSFFFSLSQ
jgi:hypothetical protein